MRAYARRWQIFEAHLDKAMFELGFFAGILWVEEMHHLDMEDIYLASAETYKKLGQLMGYNDIQITQKYMH